MRMGMELKPKGLLGPVVVVEPSRQMQHLLRAMLSGYGIRAVRVYSDTDSAAAFMLSDPPSVVLLDWDAGPYYGPNFLKLFRHQNMYPLCLVPIVVMFAEARRRWVERAARLGAQAAVVKPVAPATLHERIEWIAGGHSALQLQGDRYVVAGTDDRLEVERERQKQLKQAREYQATQFAEMAAIQSDIDKIFGSTN